MTTEPSQALAELQIYEVTDKIITEALSRVWELLNGSKIASGLHELNLCVVGSDASRRLCKSRYFTDNCKALLHENIIVISERFLLETEAVVRAFALSDGLMATPYLKSDDDISVLIGRISPDPKRYLKRARRQAGHVPANGCDDILDTLVMVVFFFISHEVGHLVDQKSARSFTSFLDPKAPLESCLANAVLKMDRHAAELDKYQFGLGGFEKKGKSGRSIRKTIEKLQKKHERLYTNNSEWFDDEISADETGTRMVIEFLSGVAQEDEVLADRYQYLMIRGLFAVSLYSWHKDLLAFCREIGLDRLESVGGLSLAMTANPKHYVSAASLFGDVHRFTFLRAVLLMESLIRARSDFFERPKKDRAIWIEHRTGLNLKPGEGESLREWWLSESLLRYFLLCTHMDTAVKLANLGSAMSWLKKVDEKRESSQIRIIRFESIDRAVERLKRIK
jgi:hypothetical protein